MRLHRESRTRVVQPTARHSARFTPPAPTSLPHATHARRPAGGSRDRRTCTSGNAAGDCFRQRCRLRQRSGSIGRVGANVSICRNGRHRSEVELSGSYRYQGRNPDSGSVDSYYSCTRTGTRRNFLLILIVRIVSRLDQCSESDLTTSARGGGKVAARGS